MGSVENKAKNPKARQIRMLPLLLSGLALLLALGPAAVRGEFFGYGSDWLSQHLPLAETLRSAMLDSGRLIPLYLNLGGGSSIYDFAYYGLLLPTGLGILSGTKDGGTFAAQQLKLLDLSLAGMLYDGYGMGP